MLTTAAYLKAHSDELRFLRGATADRCSVEN